MSYEDNDGMNVASLCVELEAAESLAAYRGLALQAIAGMKVDDATDFRQLAALMMAIASVALQSPPRPA